MDLRLDPEHVARLHYDTYRLLCARFGFVPLPSPWQALSADRRNLLTATSIEVLHRLHLRGDGTMTQHGELTADEYAIASVLSPHCASPGELARDVLHALDLPGRDERVRLAAYLEAEQRIEALLNEGPERGQRMTYDGATRRARRIVHRVLSGHS